MNGAFVMKLKKLLSVVLSALLLLTVFSAAAFAADDRVEVKGASNPRVTDTVESYLRQFGCEGLTGILRVSIVQFVENAKVTANNSAESAVNHEADDPNIDFYAEISASYTDGVRDDASITYTEAVKENGAWKTVSGSGSTFTPDRQYLYACYVETVNGVDSENIFADFGNGAMFFKITSTCAPGSAFLVPTKLLTPTGGVTGNIFERFIKAIRILFQEVREFFSMLFGR